jgi:hypothetical protein
VRAFGTTEVTLRTPREHEVNADGELVTTTPAPFQIRRAAVTVFVPGRTGHAWIAEQPFVDSSPSGNPGFRDQSRLTVSSGRRPPDLRTGLSGNMWGLGRVRECAGEPRSQSPEGKA